MYKSSPVTPMFIYFFPIFFLGGSVMSIYTYGSQADEESLAFAKAFIVATIWISLFVIQMPFRLKNIVATDMGLMVKGIGKATFIDYKDIEWLTKFDITSPWFITIKYRDGISGISKKISFMPNRYQQRIFGNDELTEYIITMMKKNNPYYSEDQSPSKLKNFTILIVLCIPFMLLSIYFLKDSIFH